MTDREMIMALCELKENCIFFKEQMANMPTTAKLFKKIYCEDEFAACGRFMVFSAIGSEKVPLDLFPNQSDRAKAIIDSQR